MRSIVSITPLRFRVLRVPPPPVSKEDGMQTAIGVDLGGSHVSAAVVTDDGAIQIQHEEDLEDLRFEAVVAALEAVVGLALRDAGNATAIGIGSPGNIDATSGAVLYSPNLGWFNVPLG